MLTGGINFRHASILRKRYPVTRWLRHVRRLPGVGPVTYDSTVLQGRSSGEPTAYELDDLRAMGWRFVGINDYERKVTMVRREHIVIFDSVLAASVIAATVWEALVSMS